MLRIAVAPTSSPQAFILVTVTFGPPIPLATIADRSTVGQRSFVRAATMAFLNDIRAQPAVTSPVEAIRAAIVAEQGRMIWLAGFMLFRKWDRSANGNL